MIRVRVVAAGLIALAVASTASAQTDLASLARAERVRRASIAKSRTWTNADLPTYPDRPETFAMPFDAASFVPKSEAGPTSYVIPYDRNWPFVDGPMKP